jgi:hypothetical protein
MKYRLTSFLIFFSLFFWLFNPSSAIGQGIYPAIIPTDTYFENEWHLKKIEAPVAWNKIRDADSIVIAIVDTGVQINHVDLKDNIWVNTHEIPENNIDDDNNGYIDDVNGWDFVNDTADPNPKFDEIFTEDGIIHGTVVAGVAAASGNNAAGISGVAWRAKIMPLKVLDSKGEGDTGKVIKAIDYAIKNGADIINFSFVGTGFSYALDAAIKRAYDAGLLIVAAAGNEQADGQGNNLDKIPMYPVCHDGDKRQNWIIGVTATDALDQKASFSSYGFNCIDLSAPGVSIFSTTVFSPNHAYQGNAFNKYYDGYWSGTSMSAPIVSGVAALIWQTNPRLGHNDVTKILLDTADNIGRLNPDYLGRMGIGRVNALKAVKAALATIKETDEYFVIAPKSGMNSKIKLIDKNGKVLKEFSAYNSDFIGGVNISTGDINNDNQEEIITTPGLGGGPQVLVYDTEGNLLSQFFAYDKNFRGGVNVAVGDVDGDGKGEIICGAGFGGGPQVRIFNSQGHIKGQFFAYDKNFRGGVNVFVTDMEKDSPRNKKEIITSPGKGGGPQVRIFDNNGKVFGQFFAYDKKFKGGMSISAGDADNDGFTEIITGAGEGGSPHLRAFTAAGILKYSFFAFDAAYVHGINVSLVNIK